MAYEGLARRECTVVDVRELCPVCLHSRHRGLDFAHQHLGFSEVLATFCKARWESPIKTCRVSEFSFSTYPRGRPEMLLQSCWRSVIASATARNECAAASPPRRLHPALRESRRVHITFISAEHGQNLPESNGSAGEAAMRGMSRFSVLIQNCPVAVSCCDAGERATSRIVSN